MVTGTVRVNCPACAAEHVCKLVQSIDARTDTDAKAQLLAGELNLLGCACGNRTQLAANLVYLDTDYTCRVVPGGDDLAMQQAAALFDAAGIAGTRRLVPSMNALVEKVAMRDAGLEDWALEMTKVLLLASIGGDALELVLLFERREADLLHWLRFDAPDIAVPTASSVAAYAKLLTQPAPKRGELRIDRAWAVAAVERMISREN